MLTNAARSHRRRSSLAAAAMAAELLVRKPTPTRLTNVAEDEETTPTRLTNFTEDEDSQCADEVVVESDGAASDSLSAPMPARRRAVDTSDLRSCALVQTRLKQMRTYPE